MSYDPNQTVLDSAESWIDAASSYDSGDSGGSGGSGGDGGDSGGDGGDSGGSGGGSEGSAVQSAGLSLPLVLGLGSAGVFLAYTLLSDQSDG